jgi:membrane protein
MFGLKFDFKQFFKRFYVKALDEEDLVSNAAQVAFYFTFALFPLLLFLISLFAIILTSADDMRAELFVYLRQMMPVSAYDLVFKTIGEVTENSSGGKVTIGIIAALWAASAGIDSIRVVLNGVYNLTETRPWWKTKLLALLLTLGLAVLVTIALGVVFYGGKFIALILGAISFTISSTFFLGLLQVITVLAVLITIFAIIYNKLPDHTEHKWVWVTPGAIVGILMWLLLSYSFRLYLGYFDSYDKTYGSLGAVIILMLWLYLTALVILVGGTINAILQEFSDPETAQAAERKAEAKEIVEDPEGQQKDSEKGAKHLPKSASEESDKPEKSEKSEKSGKTKKKKSDEDEDEEEKD